MIDKWLKAGVLEDGLLRHGTEGSPQGGVVSPCLSNIFLHHVLDEWFENEVKPRIKGEKCTLVRYADDAVMAFEDFLDAQRVLRRSGKRLDGDELRSSRQDALCRLPLHTTRWGSSSESGWHDVHLSRLLPRMGQVAERQGRGAAK